MQALDNIGIAVAQHFWMADYSYVNLLSLGFVAQLYEIRELTLVGAYQWFLCSACDGVTRWGPTTTPSDRTRLSAICTRRTTTEETR